MTLIQASERYNVQLPKKKIKTQYKKPQIYLKLPFNTKQKDTLLIKKWQKKGIVFTIAKLPVLD